MSDEFTEAVNRGVELLDRHSPDGIMWPYRIDLAELDVADWRSCVLGQLYGGDYVTGVRELERATGETHVGWLTFGVRHGFEVSAGDGTYRTLGDYEGLRRAWLTRIESLRAERRLP